TPGYCGRSVDLVSEPSGAEAAPSGPAGPGSSQLPAHAAGRGRRGDVRGDGDGFEAAVALGDGLPEGDSLGARAHGIRGILDVGAADVAPRPGEKNGAHAEPAVGAVRRRLRRDALPLQAVELVRGQAERLAGRLDVLAVCAAENP